ncbi:MAG: hypothetical protein U9Q85_02065 [Patescibacteria group bacterium]|nr:hypothetical protein [Patescibacteria group bacterium]
MKTLKFITVLFLATFILSGCFSEVKQSKNKQPKQPSDEQLIEEGKLIKTEKGLKATPEYIEELEAEEKRLDEEDNKRKMKDYEMWSELEQLEIDKVEGKNVKGSCDAIAKSSTCIEFYGSFYTEEMMRPGCDGVFSLKPCPEGMNGGCNTGVGTAADMVAWMYVSGGGEMTAASMENAAKACDSAPVSRWIPVKPVK